MCFGGNKTCLKGNLPGITFQHGQTGDFGCEKEHSELGREASVCFLLSKLRKWSVKCLM